MASLLEKIQNLWNVPDDEYSEEEEEENDEEFERPTRERRESRYNERVRNFEKEPEPERRERRTQRSNSNDQGENKVVNIHATAQLQVVVCRPERFGEETRGIAEELLRMHTVVLNLENTDKNQSRRIVDFLSGVAYANGGKIKRIATDTFIVTPYNVDLTGDDVLDELENSGVYF